MDHIYDIRDDVEKRIFDRLKELFGISDNVLFYDITSSYFEGDGCKSAQFGYSRDKRPDKKQINWGLVLTKDGFPITHEVYPGNVPDKTTVDYICDKLKNKFGISRCIFIGDRGLITEDNIKILTENKYEYIIMYEKCE
jgi:transposase